MRQRASLIILIVLAIVFAGLLYVRVLAPDNSQVKSGPPAASKSKGPAPTSLKAARELTPGTPINQVASKLSGFGSVVKVDEKETGRQTQVLFKVKDGYIIAAVEKGKIVMTYPYLSGSIEH